MLFLLVTVALNVCPTAYAQRDSNPRPRAQLDVFVSATVLSQPMRLIAPTTATIWVMLPCALRIATTLALHLCAEKSAAPIKL